MVQKAVLSSYTGVMLQDVIKSESTSQSSRSVFTASAACVVVVTAPSITVHHPADKYFFVLSESSQMKLKERLKQQKT